MKVIGLAILATLLAFTSATAQRGEYKSIDVAEGVYSFGGGPYSYFSMFVVNDKSRMQVTDISNAPFSRPELEPFSWGLGFIRDSENNYPIRGTF